MTKQKKESISDKAKRYLISAGISFLTAFAVIMATQLDNITLDSFKDGTLVGVIFMAVRAGLKGLFEYIASFQK